MLQAEESKKIEELIRSSDLIISGVTQKPIKVKPKRKPRKKNQVGNWRGVEDQFFNKVRKGFKRILAPAPKY